MKAHASVKLDFRLVGQNALGEINVPSQLRGSVLCLCEGAAVLWCEALGYSEQGKKYVNSQKLTIELSEERCYDVTQGR